MINCINPDNIILISRSYDCRSWFHKSYEIAAGKKDLP